MREINYNSLAEFLKTGREIEFAYNQKNYSINNHSGFWYLCCDTDDTLLDTVCRFEEKDVLVSKIATTIIEGKTIAQIFDELLYDPSSIDII